MNVGKLTIATAVDTTGIDKGIKNIEKKMDNVRSEIKQEVEIDGAIAHGVDIGITPEQERQLERYQRTLDQLYKQKEAMVNTSARETQEIIKQQQVMQTQSQTQTEILNKEDALLAKANERWKKAGYAGTLVNKTKEELEVERQITDEVEKQVKAQSGMGEGLTKIIRKVGHWALAVFGVRSAYSAIRSAMSIISQYDKQMATDVEYIRYALAMSLKPVIEWIVKALAKALQYVNYLMKSWTGKPIFTSAKAFESAKDNLSGTNKEAKKLNKTLAGFDEANILADNSGTSTSGTTAPSFDLTAGLEELKEGEAPEWLEKIKNIGSWIIDNWPLVLGILAGTAITIGVIKMAMGGGSSGILNIVGALASLSLVIMSIAMLIQAMADSGMNMWQVAGLLLVVFGSLIAMMVLITALGPGLATALIPFLGIVAGISAILLVMALTLPTILDALGNFITQIAPSIVSILEVILGFIENIIKTLAEGLVATVREVGNVFRTIFQGIANIISTVGDVIVRIMTTASNMTSNTLQSILNFINQLGPAINRFVDNAIRAVTKLINFLISGVEYMINTLIINAINSLLNKLNKIPGVDFDTIPRVRIERFRPTYMKGGGIIDVPRTGVRLASNVIGGEAGAEGVLPLTNADTMARLGKEIGKWITINLDLTNTIDGRVLNKRLEQLNTNREFARNGAR